MKRSSSSIMCSSALHAVVVVTFCVIISCSTAVPRNEYVVLTAPRRRNQPQQNRLSLLGTKKKHPSHKAYFDTLSHHPIDISRGGSEEEQGGIAAVTTTPPPSMETPIIPAATQIAPAAPLDKKSNSFLLRLNNNVTERVLAAIFLLTLASILVHNLGTSGIVAIVFLSQWAMYYETTKIVEDYYRVNHDVRTQKRQTYQKWWWFVTATIGCSFKALVVSNKGGWLSGIDPGMVDFVAYGMAALGLVKSVMGMATTSAAGPEAFRAHLGKIAVVHFVLFFTVAQSAFWIMTVQTFGISWIIYPSLLVIVNDTMAYVFGVLMGNKKLIPRLSPKKTWEGFLGAMVSTLCVSVPLLKFVLARSACCGMLSSGEMTKHALVLGMFVSLIAPFGGFMASAVKRAHDAKDFGTLIPGHGGVMDRFDCHVITAPFVYLYLREFGKIVGMTAATP